MNGFWGSCCIDRSTALRGEGWGEGWGEGEGALLPN